MGFSGPLRSAPPQRFPAVWLVGMALALIGPLPGTAAADAPQPPFPQTGPSAGDQQDPPPDGQAPLPDPPPPFPADTTGPIAPPTPTAPPFPTTDRLGDGPQGRADEAMEPVAADGTVSVLVPPSDPVGLTGPANPPVPPGIRPAPPFAPPPPPLAMQAAPPPLAAPLNQAAPLVARGLELPFPLVAGSPTAEVTPPRPLALLEALERSGDRTRRLWITQAYWKLAAAAAGVRFAAEAEERLALVAPGENADDLVLLDLATATARGESASAGVELVTAQQEIIDLVRLPVTDPPPWPVDRPLTAAYQTHFETIFAGRPATGRVRAIHRQLPLEYAALVARAEAVRAAESRFEAIEALHAKGKKPIGAVLTAHDAIVQQGEAFVRAVRAYNLDIAEYVMAVADLSVPDERFATMLIGQPTPWRQPLAALPFAASDRVVPVAGQSFPPNSFPQSQANLPPDVFSAGTPTLQIPPAVAPAVAPPGLPGGGDPANPAPNRFAPPANAPAGAPFPAGDPPIGG